jgi:hypothetical protein
MGIIESMCIVNYAGLLALASPVACHPVEPDESLPNNLLVETEDVVKEIGCSGDF